MLDMMVHSSKQLIQGKLFKDNKAVARQLAIGSGIGAAVIVGLGLVAPIWVAAIGGGLVAGLLQPYLFKDLKYS